MVVGVGGWAAVFKLGDGSWELDWDGERELGWDLGAEGTKSSEIQPGRPKIRLLVQNGLSGQIPSKKHHSGRGFYTGFKTRKYCIRPRQPSHTIPTFTQGFSSKMHFKRNLGSQSGSPPPQFHGFPSYYARNSPPPRSKVGAVRSEGRRVEG